LSALSRLADGEDWCDIRKSMINGRRYEPVRWL
jgi:hypothetical protein